MQDFGKKSLTILLTEEQYNFIQAVSRKEGVAMGAVIKRILTQEMEDKGVWD